MSTSSRSRHASRLSPPHPLPPNFPGLSCPCSCLTGPSISLFLSLYFGFKNGRGGKVSPFLPCRGSLLIFWVKNSDLLPVTPESCLWVFAVVHQQWWPGLETDRSWGWCPSVPSPPCPHLRFICPQALIVSLAFVLRFVLGTKDTEGNPARHNPALWSLLLH